MALKIFPPEIWELILNNVKDGPDILNILNTFPELRQEGVHHTKKPRWLFPFIIPVLCEWLSKEENEHCRQVCKTWRSGIEDFTSKDGCPNTNKESNVAIPGPFPWDIGLKFKMLRDFTTAAALNGFRNDFLVESNHEQSMNPFLMRRASFKDVYVNNPVEIDPDNVHFWERVLDFLKTYGQHLWHLDIYMRIEIGSRPTPIIFNFINKFLEHVPNLKSLKFSLTVVRRRFRVRNSKMLTRSAHSSSEETHFFQNVAFGLPKLESLVLAPGNDNVYLAWIHSSLVKSFGEGLGKLVICTSHWKESYISSFPNLTELELKNGRCDEVAQILSSIVAPNLLKVAIGFLRFNEEGDDVNGLYQNIIPTLTRFPNLECLFLQAHKCAQVEPKRRGFRMAKETITKLPSVKFVEICLSQLCFDMKLLSCFPNVTKLLICYPFAETSYYIQTRGIWEKYCPKLQEISLKGWVHQDQGEELVSRSLIRIFRSHYEHFKRSAETKKCQLNLAEQNDDGDIGLAEFFATVGVLDD